MWLTLSVQQGAIGPFCLPRLSRDNCNWGGPQGGPSYLLHSSFTSSALDPLWSTQMRGSDGTPLQYPCLESLTDGGAWWATVQGVAKSWPRLHRRAHTQEDLTLVSWVLLQMLKLPSDGRVSFLRAMSAEPPDHLEPKDGQWEAIPAPHPQLENCAWTHHTRAPLPHLAFKKALLKHIWGLRCFEHQLPWIPCLEPHSKHCTFPTAGGQLGGFAVCVQVEPRFVQ